MTCRLQVGDKYWDGASWVDTPSTFSFPIGEIGGWALGAGKILSNRTLNQTTWTSPYPNYVGYGASVTDVLYGKVTLEIVGVSSGAPAEDMPNVFCDLKNIKILFYRALAYAPYIDVSRNVYIGTPVNSIGTDKTVDTIFASDMGNAAGLGIILNPDGQGYCSELIYTYDAIGGPEHPEQHLANRMATFGHRRRHCVTLNFIESEVGDITPSTKILWRNNTYYPIAISHKYRDDIVTVKMIEL